MDELFKIKRVNKDCYKVYFGGVLLNAYNSQKQVNGVIAQIKHALNEFINTGCPHHSLVADSYGEYHCMTCHAKMALRFAASENRTQAGAEPKPTEVSDSEKPNPGTGSEWNTRR